MKYLEVDYEQYGTFRTILLFIIIIIIIIICMCHMYKKMKTTNVYSTLLRDAVHHLPPPDMIVKLIW